VFRVDGTAARAQASAEIRTDVRIAISISSRAGSIRLIVYLGREAGVPGLSSDGASASIAGRERFSGSVDSKGPAGTRPAWHEILHTDREAAPDGDRPCSTFVYYINDLDHHQSALMP
jgi:hypothetical protein